MTGQKNIAFFLFFLILLAACGSAGAQTNDSLKRLLKTEKRDTVRLQMLSTLADTEPEEIWEEYNEQMYQLAGKAAKQTAAGDPLKKKYLRYLCVAMNNKGLSSKMHGDIRKALEYYNKSLTLLEEMHDKEGVAVVLNSIGSIYKEQGLTEEAIRFYTRSFNISSETGNKASMTTTLDDIGILYLGYGNSSKALEYLTKSLKIKEEGASKGAMSGSYNLLSRVYKNLGDVAKSLDYAIRSLRMREETGDKREIGFSLSNVGEIYQQQGETGKALEFYEKSLKIQTEIDFKEGMALALNNIGGIYYAQQDINKALGYFLKSLDIRKQLQFKEGIALGLNNVGFMYDKLNKPEQALDYFSKSAEIYEEISNKEGLAGSYHNISGIYERKGDIAKATLYAQKSLDLAKETGYPEKIRNSADLLKDLYFKQGKYKEAYDMFSLYISMKDSINNTETRKAAVKKQLQYQYEKKAAADSIKTLQEKTIKDAQIGAAKAQLKQEQTARYALYGGLAIVLVFSFFLYNRFVTIRKQKNIIEEQKQLVESQKKIVEEQKHVVEEKQQEILDSITYAKRLQQAILPPLTLISDSLPESFVLYKPKDIVAGDFYWMEVVDLSQPSTPDSRLILIAAADCTGHGVPGAMVSVVCSNALNRAVKEFGISDPGKILDKVRELVIETFEKSEDEVKDGMDISICAISRTSDKQMMIRWAGANNPGWYIQNSVLNELKPDKQPIGKYAEQKPFTTQSICLNKGDTFYIFTDGYADQFGGPKGKKFKYKQLEDVLIRNAGKPMLEQKQLLDTEFENWKGALEQIDDVCIIGFKA